jgi:hypothetical protein
MSGPEIPVPADLFGPGSDGGMRMSEWLDVMCLGCKRESARDRREGTGGGSGCELVSRAICGPYKAPMPEWPVDAACPERLDVLGDGPWPVCMAYEPRAVRSDKGLRRGPRVPAAQGSLFEGETS